MSEPTGKLGTRYMQEMQNQEKSQFAKACDEFKELLRDKTHPDNQTPAFHKNRQGTIHRVLSAASSMDQVVPGEGIFGLFALILGTNLALKDKVIELEVENNRLKKQLKKAQNG